jgi:hypothetical protein
MFQNSPYRDIKLLEELVTRGPFVDVDTVQLFLLDVEESYRVGLFFPERTFAERAVQLNIWLFMLALCMFWQQLQFSVYC